MLAKSADQIRVGDIIRTVEGPIALVHCVAPQQEEATCPRVDSCVTHLLWQRLSDKVAEVLDSVTLKDLCDQAHDLKTRELKEVLGQSRNPLILG